MYSQSSEQFIYELDYNLNDLEGFEATITHAILSCFGDKCILMLLQFVAGDFFAEIKNLRNLGSKCHSFSILLLIASKSVQKIFRITRVGEIEF